MDITPEMSKAGSDMAALLYDVTIDKSLCNVDTTVLINGVPKQFRVIVKDYLAEKISSEDAIYLAMENAK